MSKNDKEKVLNKHININGGNKSTKSGGKYNSRGGSNNGHVKWKSKIDMLYKEFMNQKRKLSAFNAVAKPDSEDQ